MCVPAEERSRANPHHSMGCCNQTPPEKTVGSGRRSGHQGQASVVLHFLVEKQIPGRCLCARRACRALLCQGLVVENITCLAPCYLCSVLKSGTLINYYSKVLIKHQSKAGLLGWGLL